MQKIIGVVGGMGPYAGLDLLHKIFDQTKASSDQEHLPVIMLSFPNKIADRSAFLSGKIKKNPGQAIAGLLKKLIKMGTDPIGIACNSAHAKPIFDCVLQNLDNKHHHKLVHMIEEVVLFIKEKYPQIGRVGVLSTYGTLKAGIYPQILKKFSIEAVQLDDTLQQRLIHPVLYDPAFGIKAQSSPVTEKAKILIKPALQYLLKQKVEAIILGCTELPLAMDEKTVQDIPIIDSSSVLARALIKRVDGSKLVDG